MSVYYCHACDRQVDTDWDTTHEEDCPAEWIGDHPDPETLARHRAATEEEQARAERRSECQADLNQGAHIHHGGEDDPALSLQAIHDDLVSSPGIAAAIRHHAYSMGAPARPMCGFAAGHLAGDVSVTEGHQGPSGNAGELDGRSDDWEFRTVYHSGLRRGRAVIRVRKALPHCRLAVRRVVWAFVVLAGVASIAAWLTHLSGGQV